MKCEFGTNLKGEYKMSYCRCGNDSDVYVYCGTKFSVNFAQGKDSCAELMKIHNVDFQYYFETEKETLDFLLYARSLGFVVPDRAIERLQNEIASFNK
jgi:hypothetical protein